MWDLGQMWDLPGVDLTERQMQHHSARRHSLPGCWERTEERSKEGRWLQRKGSSSNTAVITSAAACKRPAWVQQQQQQGQGQRQGQGRMGMHRRDLRPGCQKWSLLTQHWGRWTLEARPWRWVVALMVVN